MPPFPARADAPMRAVRGDGSDPADATAGSQVWWDEHEARLRRRRPRADGLTLERILDEALTVVDAEGLDALTVRSLAEQVSTGSSSLYRHVASRDELLVLLVDRVLGDVPLPAPTDDPRGDVVRLAADLRDVLVAHPNLVPALRVTPLAGPQARRAAEAGLARLLAVGYPPEVAVPGFLALLDYVLGSVLFDSAASAATDLAMRPPEIDGLPDLDPPPTPDDVFGFGVTTFLAGLDARTGTRER